VIRLLSFVLGELTSLEFAHVCEVGAVEVGAGEVSARETGEGEPVKRVGVRPCSRLPRDCMSRCPGRGRSAAAVVSRSGIRSGQRERRSEPGRRSQRSRWSGSSPPLSRRPPGGITRPGVGRVIQLDDRAVPAAPRCRCRGGVSARSAPRTRAWSGRSARMSWRASGSDC
jgi:hypothetical protein